MEYSQISHATYGRLVHGRSLLARIAGRQYLGSCPRITVRQLPIECQPLPLIVLGPIFRVLVVGEVACQITPSMEYHDNLAIHNLRLFFQR